MKLLLLPSVIAVGYLIGQAVTPPDSVWRCVTEAGALGALVAYFWFVSVRTIPGLTNAFREEAREAREHNAAQLDKIVKRWDYERSDRHDEIRTLLQELYNSPSAQRERSISWSREYQRDAPGPSRSPESPGSEPAE